MSTDVSKDHITFILNDDQSNKPEYEAILIPSNISKHLPVDSA